MEDDEPLDVLEFWYLKGERASGVAAPEPARH